MSKGIKIVGWLVFVICVSGSVTFGVLAYQQYQIVTENLFWEERFGLYLDGWIDDGDPLYDDIVEGHEAYTTAFTLFTNYVLVGGGILTGGIIVLFIELLMSWRRMRE